MTGKTHIAANAAITTAILHPTAIEDLAIVLAASTIGSIISDIDVTTSESHKELDKIIGVSAVSLILCSLIEFFFGIKIIEFIRNDANLAQIFIGFIAFLVVCWYGMHKPHRSFMHSILGVILTTGCFYLILPIAAIPFAIGMLTHIFLDLFNKRNVKLFFPLKFKISFGLCPANGKANKFICNFSLIIFIAELALFTVNLIL